MAARWLKIRDWHPHPEQIVEIRNPDTGKGEMAKFVTMSDGTWFWDQPKHIWQDTEIDFWRPLKPKQVSTAT